jgi:hypothetical protein
MGGVVLQVTGSRFMEKLFRILRRCAAVALTITSCSVTLSAAEIVTASGTLEPAPAGQFLSGYFLRDANRGGLVAALRDPRNLLIGSDKHVTLQAETSLVPEVNGLPVLKVLGVTPEFWAEPAVWRHWNQLPGGFSGYPAGPKPKDFAGVPFTTSRAYRTDNGLETRRLDAPNEFETPTPTRFDASLVDGRIKTLITSFQAYAGLTYELQALPTLGVLPDTIWTLSPTSDGLVTTPGIQPSSSMGFYVLRVSAPPTLF